MRTLIRTLASLAAVLLAVTLSLTPAVAEPSAPALAANQGTLSGTILGSTSPYDYVLVITPITGDGTPDIVSVHTTSGGAFAPIPVVAGSYHVLVRADNGSAAAGWFGGATLTDTAASRVVVTAGATTTVDWVLGDSTSVTGTTSGGDPGLELHIQAFATEGTGPFAMAEAFVGAGDPWTLSGLGTGDYTIVIQEFAGYPQSWTTVEHQVSLVGTDPAVDVGSIPLTRLPGSKPIVIRYEGPDRYETARQIAIGWIPPHLITDVFVVSGASYADALSAGPAAARLAGPILLVKPNSITPTVAQYLADSDFDTIHIVGGTGAVSAAVEAQLQLYAPTVTRTAGADRYATARAVAAEFFGSTPGTYYLATGTNFPDALAAGPAAARAGGPVLLVRGTSPTLDDETTTLIDAQPVTFPVQIAGGPASVSKGIDDALYALVHDHRRRQGNDRYSTASDIVLNGFSYTEAVYLATGSNFPDALAAVATAGTDGAPILLVHKNCIPRAAMDEIDRLRPNNIYVLGGTGVISAAVANLTACPTY